MKIVCDACQAKYSISDDKVSGKVFKIRCKKCSNVIVVRGGAGAAPPVAQPPIDETTGDEAIWHLVIDQDQIGPLTAAEVQRKLAAGDIDRETLTWREGLADWLPLASVDAFAAGLVGSDDAGTPRGDQADVFAAAAHAGSDDGGELFSHPPASSPAQNANQKLRGERNESSVLFSLNNLAQLANKPAVTAAPGQATGPAGGEGSGLMDIRSMANAYRGTGHGTKPASSIGSIDDLPVFGASSFSEPAVLVPSATRPSNTKLLYGMIGAVGLLLVAAGVIIFMLVHGGGTKEASAGPNRGEAAPPVKPPDGSGTLVAAAQAAPTTEHSETLAPSAPITAHSDTTAPVASTTEHGSDTSAPPAPARSNPPRTNHPAPNPNAGLPKGPKAKAPPVATVETATCDEVSCMLSNYEGACCVKFKPSTESHEDSAKTKSRGDLPDKLDRSMITAGIGNVQSRVTACGGKSSAKGKVKVHVKVAPDGHVANVSVESSPDPAITACVSAAMQKASFAKTQTGGSFNDVFTF